MRSSMGADGARSRRTPTRTGGSCTAACGSARSTAWTPWPTMSRCQKVPFTAVCADSGNSHLSTRLRHRSRTLASTRTLALCVVASRPRTPRCANRSRSASDRKERASSSSSCTRAASTAARAGKAASATGTSASHAVLAPRSAAATAPTAATSAGGITAAAMRARRNK